MCACVCVHANNCIWWSCLFVGLVFVFSEGKGARCVVGSKLQLMPHVLSVCWKEQILPRWRWIKMCFQFNPFWLHTVVPYLSSPALLISDIPRDLQPVQRWLPADWESDLNCFSVPNHRNFTDIQHFLTWMLENIICPTQRTSPEFVPKERNHIPENKQAVHSGGGGGGRKKLCSDVQVNLYEAKTAQILPCLGFQI